MFSLRYPFFFRLHTRPIFFSFLSFFSGCDGIIPFFFFISCICAVLRLIRYHIWKWLHRYISFKNFCRIFLLFNLFSFLLSFLFLSKKFDCSSRETPSSLAPCRTACFQETDKLKKQYGVSNVVKDAAKPATSVIFSSPCLISMWIKTYITNAICL